MLRKTTINLNATNVGKKKILLDILYKYNVLVNFYINYTWENKLFDKRFLSTTELPEINIDVTARLKQAAMQQALGIVKSQRKRKKKTKPIYKRLLMELSSNFVEFHEDKNSFDFWLKLKSIKGKVGGGNGLKLWFPSKKHFHYNKFKDWNRKKSIRIYQNKKGVFADVYFEKEQPKSKGNKFLAIDIGYKKLLVDSNGNQYGKELEQKIEKITRKVQKSKAFKRALIERDEYINKELKKLDLKEISTLYVEALKNLKYKTKQKRKLNKKFRSKQQYWTYSKILKKLELLAEENNVCFQKIDPAYTSQICSSCGKLDKSSRRGECFSCKNCGFEIDADFNAAKNILHRGTGKYGSCGLQAKFNNLVTIC